ncbi:M48 family metalloprotease [Friedmanniella luteola]|uniref:M48 family metalloprotease n=1 Tax=Friedmanniella luteola TaxID=546871 RepID=UPI0018D3948A|nr:M48 family metalloprotease [Friedmanniella luteola]
MPLFVVMVVLNIAIVAMIVNLALFLPFLPDRYRDTSVATAVRTAFVGLLLLIPLLIVIGETQRASVRGTAVELSPHQFPELYATADEFARVLGLDRRPDLFLMNGNGALNAFAAQATGHDDVVLSNELFVNLHDGNREGLHFILGHELGHIRLHHVALWYQVAIAYSGLIPVLGPDVVPAARVLLRPARRPPVAQRRGGSGAPGFGTPHRGRRGRRSPAPAGHGGAGLLGRPRPAAEIAPVHGAPAGAPASSRILPAVDVLTGSSRPAVVGASVPAALVAGSEQGGTGPGTGGVRRVL